MLSEHDLRCQPYFSSSGTSTDSLIFTVWSVSLKNSHWMTHTVYLLLLFILLVVPLICLIGFNQHFIISIFFKKNKNCLSLQTCRFSYKWYWLPLNLISLPLQKIIYLYPCFIVFILCVYINVLFPIFGLFMMQPEWQRVLLSCVICWKCWKHLFQ